MARRPRRSETPRAPEPQPSQSVALKSILPQSGAIVLCVALALVIFGGGALYDRVIPFPDYTSFVDILGFPIAALAAGWLLTIVAWRTEGLRPASTEARLFWTFALLVIAGTAFAKQPYFVWNGAALVLAAVSLGSLVSRLCEKRLNLGWVTSTIVACASLVAVFGIREYLVQFRNGNATWRIFGTFINPDFLAGFMLLTIPLTAAFVIAAKDRPVKFLLALGTLLQSIALLMTGSRLGLAAFIIEVVLFVVLLARSGAVKLPRTSRMPLIVGGVVVVLILTVAARPVLRRLMVAGVENYSAQFRIHTWKGTLRMAASNPIFGVGIGSFESGYPSYAEVGFTQHAHGSIVQLAGEVGAPALICLLIGWFLILKCGIRLSKVSDTPDETHFGRVIAMGATVGLTGSLLHNLIDSDLYVPAITLTTAALIGLIGSVRAAELEEPVDPHELWPMGVMRALSTVIAVVLTFMAYRAIAGRTEALSAVDAYERFKLASRGLISENPRNLMNEALAGYKAAHASDPLNPEYIAKLGGLLESAGQKSDALALYLEATTNTPLAKWWYRLGKVYREDSLWPAAILAHRKATELEPNNLQNLLALGDVQLASGDRPGAVASWRKMADLYPTVMGQVRPVPELVDWEYGMAFANLAESAILTGNPAQARPDLDRAVTILNTFWAYRKMDIAESRFSPEVREQVVTKLDWCLTQVADMEARAGNAVKEREIRARLDLLRQERQADKAKNTT